VLALDLGDSANLIRKCQRLREILEGVQPLQMSFSVESPTSAELLQQLPRAESLQRRHTASIAAFLVCEFHRHLLYLQRLTGYLEGIRLWSGESAAHEARTERPVTR